MAANKLTEVPAILTPAMGLALKPMSDNFYAELDEFDGFRNHVLLGEFSWDEDWPTWEVHPNGDELVYLVEGDSDFVLANDDGTETVVRLAESGQYVRVPQGTWHTARPHAPTRCLFVTPGEGTINALQPGGDPV